MTGASKRGSEPSKSHPVRPRDGRLTSQGRQVPHPRRKGLRWAKGSCLGSQGCARFILNPILNIDLEGQGNSSELQGISEDLGAISQRGTLKKDCPACRGTLTVRELSSSGTAHIIINSISDHHHPSCHLLRTFFEPITYNGPFSSLFFLLLFISLIRM